MKKVAVIFGTRPEVIKMAPVIWELKKCDTFRTVVINAAQHRNMLDQMLPVLEIEPDEDLDVMIRGQDLSGLTVNILHNITQSLKRIKPDLLLVQGDTTTVFASALSAFYAGIPVGHVEAGLRSGNMLNPFPEEANRKLVGTLSHLHFAPTQRAKENLIQENIPSDKIFVTGNTVIDALLATANKNLDNNLSESLIINNPQKLLVLITSYRRESWGESMHKSFKGIRKLADRFDHINFLFPVHLNPVVREVAQKVFGNAENVYMIRPLDYVSFVHAMKKAVLIITDSGGIQEEAPAFGTPVLVMRDTTERQEAIDSGRAILVGSNPETIYNAGAALLTDRDMYAKMSRQGSPFGDGKAGQRIAKAVLRWLAGSTSLLDPSEQF